MKNYVVARILTTFLIIILAATAYAANGISGRWIGWVYWKFDGDGPKCTAQMSFVETPDKFVYERGYIDCDIITMDVPERIFIKSNSQLILNGEVVGKYDNQVLEWTERYNDRTVINVHIKSYGTNMDYKETWIEDDSKMLYDITGRLFKESSN